MREDGTSIYYNYDAAARLVGEDWLDSSSAALYAYEYEFDAAGNRARLTKDAVATYYAYNSLNQLTRTEDTLGALTYYEYQADGATSRKHDGAGWTYFTWDVDEALREIGQVGADRSTKQVNTYDAEMKRVSRTSYVNDFPAGGSHFISDGEKVAHATGSGSNYDHFLSEGPSIYSPLVSRTRFTMSLPPRVDHHWHLFDALGSTIGIADEDGDLADTYLYDAFGNLLEDTGSTGDPYLYIGAYGYYEEILGLMLGRFGWYGSRSGLSLSRVSGGYGYAFASEAVPKRGGRPGGALKAGQPPRDWTVPPVVPPRRTLPTVADCDRQYVSEMDRAVQRFADCVTWIWDRIDPENLCGTLCGWSPGRPVDPARPNGPVCWEACMWGGDLIVKVPLTIIMLVPCNAELAARGTLALARYGCCMGQVSDPGPHYPPIPGHPPLLRPGLPFQPPLPPPVVSA